VTIERREAAPVRVRTLAAGPRFPGRFYLAWLTASDHVTGVRALDAGGKPAGHLDRVGPATYDTTWGAADIVEPVQPTPPLLTLDSSVGRVRFWAFRHGAFLCWGADSPGGGQSTCIPPSPLPQDDFAAWGRFDGEPSCGSSSDQRTRLVVGLAAGMMDARVTKLRYDFADGRSVDVATHAGGPDPSVRWYLAELPKRVAATRVTMLDRAGRTVSQRKLTHYDCR
jgi:hypothetical protein